MTLVYLESYRSIEIANAIFGYDGWSCEIKDIHTEIDQKQNGKNIIYSVYTEATVRITLQNGIFHEDVGIGSSIMGMKTMAIELSRKEAISDARKRALRCFGNILGNSLYDTSYTRLLDTNHSKPPKEPLTYNSIQSYCLPTINMDEESNDLNSSLIDNVIDPINENEPIKEFKEVKEIDEDIHNDLNSKDTLERIEKLTTPY